MSLDISLKCLHCHSKVYSGNITHNLGKMAAEAGIYEAMWHPDRINAKVAADIVEILRSGVAALASQPARFQAFNPENGWGNYEGLLRVARAYLEACEKHPDAEITAWA